MCETCSEQAVMSGACAEGGFSSLGCFVHSPQPVAQSQVLLLLTAGQECGQGELGAAHTAARV